MPVLPAFPGPTRPRRRPQRGAAAVEFALVSGLLLFPLLIGIIQYGLYFNDSIAARQGVREAARQGVVRTTPVMAPCTAASTDMDKIRCNTKVQIGALMGTAYVKVWYPNPPRTNATDPVNPAWVKGNALKVCAAISFNGPINLVPMPNQGWIRTQTTMSVEQDATPLPTGATVSDPLPSGQDWSWCPAP